MWWWRFHPQESQQEMITLNENLTNSNSIKDNDQIISLIIIVLIIFVAYRAHLFYKNYVNKKINSSVTV